MGLSINFPADLEPDNKRRVLRLELGKRFSKLESKIKNISSSALKEMIRVDNFASLQARAESHRQSVNSYVLHKIQDHLLDKPNGLVAGLEGTYRGDTDDFFHHLFSYLEAFSPNFVTAIAHKYAPNAKVLLDPFGGLGTAPFSFTQSDTKAHYCEINPLMQRIAKLKSYLRESTPEQRKSCSEMVVGVADKLHELVNSKEPDLELKHSYESAFSGSQFFIDDTLDQVLRFRTLVDDLYCQDRMLATCIELSILASLVTASEMKRAGDLRRKRPQERKKVSPDLVIHVASKLNSFKEGLLSFDQWDSSPSLIAEDSRTLKNVPSVSADIVITSPPYLNGTNYFRNTKIELWFIRVIRGKHDIGMLRDKAITAGINDVRGVRAKELPPGATYSSLSNALEKLDKCAYDQRIPKMIRWYGYDLNQALAGTIGHLKKNGVIAVDIGDSIYCDVLVPTDKLVEEILIENGCEIVETLVVRRRTSRSGVEVKQVCIVGKKVTLSKRRNLSKKLKNRKWIDFKEQLPHKLEPYSKRNWGHPNHSLCSYQGKLKPAIANFLTDAFVPENGSVLDPFSGVGTIPFEAALKGKVSYGFDISPAAIAISRAKLARPKEDELHNAVEELAAFIKKNKTKISTDIWLPNFNKNLEDYYHLNTLKEILCAREWFKSTKDWDQTQAQVLACTMHILHGNRPYALSRRSHPVTPFAPSGEFEDKSLIKKLQEKLNRTIAADYPDAFEEGKIYYQDATDPWPLEIENIDAVITSPPFYDSTRFHLANWIRLWFAGWGENEFKFEQKRFIDEKQKQSFDCYDSIFRSSKERLKTGGSLVFHLGKSSKCDMAQVLLDKSKYWFAHHEIFNESVAHCESHGVRDVGTVTDHQYLVLY